MKCTQRRGARWVAVAVAALVVLGPAPPAGADSRTPEDKSANAAHSAPGETGFGPTLLRRPHSVALVEAGIIALPTAPISPAARGGKTPFGSFGKGDATVLVGLHAIFRPQPDWAFGAGVMFGPQPTSESFTVDGTNLERTHSRSYFTLGGEIRYFPLQFTWFEGWFGVTGGMVSVADRYATVNGPQYPTILGTPESTIHTEGVSLGLEAGADWMFADRWMLGLALRTERWILPNTRATNAFGDSATLVGIVEVLKFGLNLGYRLPL